MAKNTSGQDCCSLHGWMKVLPFAEGDFTTIIHSDINCSNLLDKKSYRKDIFKNVFCTNLTESDIILGNSSQKLKRCISEVAKLNETKNILILNSCMSLIIGEDIKKTIKEFENNTDVKLHFYNTSGLTFEDPKKIIDEAGCFILNTLKKPSTTKDNSINIIGFDYYLDESGNLRKELNDFILELDKFGIKINSIINPYQNIKKWEESLKGKINITFDKRLYANTCKKYYEEFGINTIEVPMPSTPNSIKEFIEIIFENIETDNKSNYYEFQKKINENKKFIQNKIKELQQKKIIYNIASNLDFSTSNSAKEGLLMLNFFKELGCSVEILIQGNPETENKERIKKDLESIGIKDNFTLFGHCGDAYKFLDGSPNTIVYGSTLLKAQAEEKGNKFLEYNDILPGLANMKKNIEKILD